MPTFVPAIWLLAGIRFAAIFIVSPFFGHRLLPRLALIPLAGALGVFAAAVVAPPGVPGAGMSIGAGEAVFEIFVGLLLGLASRLLFSIFEVLGEWISWLLLPAGGIASPALGGGKPQTVFVTLLGTCFFFLVGGHHALIGAFVSTLSCLPPGGTGGPAMAAMGLAEQFAAVFSVMLTWSVLLALPLFFVAVTVELTGGIFTLFGQFALKPAIPLCRVLATELLLVALWFTIVRVAIGHLLGFVDEHPLCAMMSAK